LDRNAFASGAALKPPADLDPKLRMTFFLLTYLNRQSQPSEAVRHKGFLPPLEKQETFLKADLITKQIQTGLVRAVHKL
jgi:hypothetical protein